MVKKLLESWLITPLNMHLGMIKWAKKKNHIKNFPCANLLLASQKNANQPKKKKPPQNPPVNSMKV